MKDFSFFFNVIGTAIVTICIYFGLGIVFSGLETPPTFNFIAFIFILLITIGRGVYAVFEKRYELGYGLILAYLLMLIFFGFIFYFLTNMH